ISAVTSFGSDASRCLGSGASSASKTDQSRSKAFCATKPASRPETIPIGVKSSFIASAEPLELIGEFGEKRQRRLGRPQSDQRLAIVREPLAVGVLAAFVQLPYLGQLVGRVDRRDAAVAGNPAAVLGLALAVGGDRPVLGHLSDQVGHLGAELG